MSTTRYRKSEKYKEFVKHASNGDKLLFSINHKIIKQGEFTAHQRNVLHSILNSNLFLKQFELPFKYKLDQLGPSCTHEGKCGDRVEAYLWWRYKNYGLKSAENYVENQIIKITNNLNNVT